MSISSCCVKGFEWGGVPTGHVDRIADLDVYVAGDDDASAASACGILIIHDLLGWTYPNARLLADHYAHEIPGAAVYLPDFFAGETLPAALVDAERWSGIDMAGFMGRNSRQAREPLIFSFAEELCQRHDKVGAVGFCYGGWAAFRLGAPGEDRPPLADCVSVGHPSLLTTADIDAIRVPVQILAPEVDPVYTAELKRHTFESLQASGVPFDYQHFPGVGHACLVRGDEKKDGESGHGKGEESRCILDEAQSA